MKNSLNRFTAALACAALTIGLTLPAQAAEAPASIRVSSYKGSTLNVGEISGLIVYPYHADDTAVSSDSAVVSVKNVMGHWTASAQGPGTATITITSSSGQTGKVTITVESSETVPPVSESTDDHAEVVENSSCQADNMEIRQEMVRLINQVRRENGVGELPVNTALMEAAQDCTRQGFKSHDTRYECESALRHGYPYGFGSNLTVFTYNSNTDIAQTAVTHWTYSPGHFQTMTAERYDSIGVGITLRDDVAYCYMFAGNSNGINPYA